MKNIYHKIILSALITACAVVLTCGDDPGEYRGMVWIPSGNFMMGSEDKPPVYALSEEKPRHKVTLTKGFWMSRYEITQEQFFSIMKNRPANFVSGNRRPADGLNWYEAIVFCNRLSIKEGLNPVYSIDGSTNPDDWGDIPTFADTYPTAPLYLKWDAVIMLGTYPDVPNGYRLPTEAEWEYACRAGMNDSLFNWGTDSVSQDQANYNKGETIPVGSCPPNAWGLYEMHGNVAEWCWDWCELYTVGDKTDPTGPQNSSLPPYQGRILRGGGYLAGSPGYISSATRMFPTPNDNTSAFLGFRVVRR